MPTIATSSPTLIKAPAARKSFAPKRGVPLPAPAKRVDKVVLSAEAKTREPHIYVVKPGDNLSKILEAKGFKNLYAKDGPIKKLNLRNPNLIYPGQKLDLSVLYPPEPTSIKKAGPAAPKLPNTPGSDTPDKSPTAPTTPVSGKGPVAPKKPPTLSTPSPADSGTDKPPVPKKPSRTPMAIPALTPPEMRDSSTPGSLGTKAPRIGKTPVPLKSGPTTPTTPVKLPRMDLEPTPLSKIKRDGRHGPMAKVHPALYRNLRRDGLEPKLSLPTTSAKELMESKDPTKLLGKGWKEVEGQDGIRVFELRSPDTANSQRVVIHPDGVQMVTEGMFGKKRLVQSIFRSPNKARRPFG